ncbi:MAG: hypothetical protein FD180_196 [Planctomycetota bacterium]|nr:MAG: hypothetical protein FD180_196 [Planctomycetota bacterium]
MVPVPDLRLEFGRRVDRRIDLSSDDLLRLHECSDDVPESRVADHHEINVAFRTQAPPGRGTENEGGADPGGEACERRPQDVDDAGRLDEEGMHLRVDRRAFVRLEVDLPSLHRALQETCSRQRAEFALYGAERGAREPSDLPEVEGFVRVKQEPGKDAAPGQAEEGFGSTGGKPRLDSSHYEYKCTQNEYERPARDQGSSTTQRRSNRYRSAAQPLGSIRGGVFSVCPYRTAISSMNRA